MDLIAESEDPDIAPVSSRPSSPNVPDYSDLPKSKEQAEPGLQNRGFRVVGQSGIGKSFWLLFSVTKRLLERQPTFLQLVPGSFVLFCEQGVFQFGNDVIKALHPTSFTPKEFYFIDSNQYLISPPHSVVDSDVRIVQTVLPRFERMDWDNKETATTINYYMKPLTLHEVLFA